MTIRVSTPGGARIEFPDGTTQSTIESVMRGNFGPASSQPQQQTSTPAAALEGASQGLTFGFADEIEGAARAGVKKMRGDERPFSILYDEGVAIPRERNKQAADTNPVAYYGGEIAGGMVAPGGVEALGVRSALRTAAKEGLPTLIKAGAKEGAAIGGAFGAGTSEGGLENRAEGAAKGAVVGTAMGAAAPVVSGVGGAVATKIATPFRNAARSKQFAAEKFGEALGRDRGGGEDLAAANRALDRLDKKMASLTQTDAGKDTILADLGGENTKNLLRTAANMPSKEAQRLKSRIDTRQANQYRAIERELSSTLGPHTQYHATIEQAAARMEEAGKNIIAPALKIETPMTPKLHSVMERPTAKELWDLSKRRLADEGREIGLVNRTEQLHYMKMTLDDRIGIAKKAEQMGNTPQAGWDARTLTILKKDLLGAIDNSTYKAGLRHYASHAQLKNAAEDGKADFFKLAPEEIRSTLKPFDLKTNPSGMTDAERNMWRLGAARAIVDRVRQGNVLRDRTENLFSSPDIQLRMEEIFPNNASRRQFQKMLVIKAKEADTRKAVQGNSMTAKQLMQGGEAGQAIADVRDVAGAATGAFHSVLNLIARQAQRFSGITPQVAAEIINIATQKGLGNLRPQLAQAMLRAERSPARRAKLTRALAAAGVAAAAPATSEREVTLEAPAGP